MLSFSEHIHLLMNTTARLPKNYNAFVRNVFILLFSVLSFSMCMLTNPSIESSLSSLLYSYSIISGISDHSES